MGILLGGIKTFGQWSAVFFLLLASSSVALTVFDHLQGGFAVFADVRYGLGPIRRLRKRLEWARRSVGAN
jgi:hypothetical protein